MISKKGMSGFDIVYWVPRIFFLVMMLVSVYYVARIYESKSLDTAETEATVFKNYLLYNPDTLSYRDSASGRVYPGIIDLANFNSGNLETAADFGQNNRMVAARLTLYDPAKAPDYFLSEDSGSIQMPPADAIIAQAFYNEQAYSDWIPLTYSTFLGPGAVFKADNATYVLYIDLNGAKNPAVLITEILVPRT